MLVLRMSDCPSPTLTDQPESKQLKRFEEKSGVFEQLHTKPVEVYSNHKDGESQGHQEAIIPVILEGGDYGVG